MDNQEIIFLVLRHYPQVAGIYFFGTYGTPDERPDSDLDIALLFTPDENGKEEPLSFRTCKDALEVLTNRDVDLINLRKMTTVFQNEIVTEGRLVYTSNTAEIDIFEMQVLSSWQKLNEERAAILEDILTSGRIL
jgi:uncharacterized protein